MAARVVENVRPGGPVRRAPSAQSRTEPRTAGPADVAARKSADDAVRNNVQVEVDRLHFAGLLGVGRDRASVRLHAGKAIAGLHDVADEEAEQEREVEMISK